MSYDSNPHLYGSNFSASIHFAWRGPWNTAFVYTRGNLVYYGTSTYLAKVTNIGQQPSLNSAYWDIFAEGETGPQGPPGTQGVQGIQGIQGIQGSPGASFNFRGAWVSGTNYALDDAVNYSGSLYLATVAIPNSTQVPSSSSSWALLVTAGANGTNGTNGTNGINGTNGANGTNGISFIWYGPFVYQNNYAINDVVYYDGSCYICTGNVTSSNYPNLATNSWQIMVDGVAFHGTYSTGTTYNINDIVMSGGSSYISLASSNVGQSLANGSYWQLLAGGVNFTNSTHSTLNAYLKGDVVTSSGGNDGIAGVLYIAIQNVPSSSQSGTNVLLTDTAHWLQFGGTPGATGAQGPAGSSAEYVLPVFATTPTNPPQGFVGTSARELIFAKLQISTDGSSAVTTYLSDNSGFTIVGATTFAVSIARAKDVSGNNTDATGYLYSMSVQTAGVTGNLNANVMYNVTPNGSGVYNINFVNPLNGANVAIPSSSSLIMQIIAIF